MLQHYNNTSMWNTYLSVDPISLARGSHYDLLDRGLLLAMKQLLN